MKGSAVSPLNGNWYPAYVWGNIIETLQKLLPKVDK